MWLQICQGLMLIGWLVGLVAHVIYAVSGRDAVGPTGALGIFITLVWYALAGLVTWRSGAISTIVGLP
jgi:hypothetical protein